MSSKAHAASASGQPGGRGGTSQQAVHSVSVVLDKAGTAYITQTTDQGTIESVDSSAGTIKLTSSMTQRSD
jgi:hypothetical protein